MYSKWKEDVVMTGLFKRLSVLAVAAIAAICVFMAFSSCRTYAAQDLELEKYDIDFDVDFISGGSVGIMRKEGCTETIKSAVADVQDVVCPFISSSKTWLFVYPIGKGETNIKVTGSEGTELTVTAKVSDAALQESLKFCSSSEDLDYGHSSIKVCSLPGAKVSVKIGNDKYKAFTLPKKNNDSVSKTMKVKKGKMYNLKTKITVTFTKGSAKVTMKYKVVTASAVDLIAAKKKTVKVLCFDVHKGDKVKLTIGGKTYTKKIKKNYTNKYYTVKFKTRKNVKKNAKFKVVIRNKYKKTLHTAKDKLFRGKWEPMDIYGDEE